MSDFSIGLVIETSVDKISIESVESVQTDLGVKLFCNMSFTWLHSVILRCFDTNWFDKNYLYENADTSWSLLHKEWRAG